MAAINVKKKIEESEESTEKTTVETTDALTPEAQMKTAVEMQAATVKVLKSVEQTMARLEEVLSGEKTSAENQEAVGKQLADAKRINTQNKAVIHQEAALPADMLFKGLTDETPKDVGKVILDKTFSTHTEAEVIKDWQRHLTEIKILTGCLKVRPEELQIWKGYEAFLDESGIGEKIVTVAGAPTNYIPEGWSNELLQYFYQELEVAALFMEFTMPQNPFDWKLLGRPTATLRPERTSATSTRGTNDPTYSDPPSGNVRFDADVLMVPVQITEEFNEDAIMGYMDTLIQETIPGAMAEGWEDAIINGDVRAGNSHQDSGSTLSVATDSAQRYVDGIRRIALERSATVNAGTYNFSVFSKLARAGGKYTVKPRDGAWIMSNSAYTQCLDFDQVKTLDKYNMPTNTTGAVNMILGRPVIVSGEYREDLDDAGIRSDTAANNVKTGFTHVNRRQFRIGARREERVSMEFDNRLQTWVIISTMRKDFQTMENRRSGYTPSVSAINITALP